VEEHEAGQQSPIDSADTKGDTSIPPVATRPAPSAPLQVELAQVGPAPCPTCGIGPAAAPSSYVYVMGRIEARFPRLSVEKEFAQATRRAETVNLTDRQAFQQVLQQNRYLVKQLCWVMTVGGLETYIIVPRDPTDSQLLVEAHPAESASGRCRSCSRDARPDGNARDVQRSRCPDRGVRPYVFVRP
jgi:hypothetical protein